MVGRPTIAQMVEGGDKTFFEFLLFSNALRYGMGAHILNLRTIGFGTSGRGQLGTSDNWPRAQLASRTIGSMKV